MKRKLMVWILAGAIVSLLFNPVSVNASETVDEKLEEVIEIQDSTIQAHSGVLADDGTLWMWGWNICGQLGIGSSETQSTIPIEVMKNVVCFDIGDGFSAAVKSNGELCTWGENWSGKLGDGSAINKDTPVKILDDVAKAALGDQHGAAVKKDGSLWLWGYNGYGQLGNGTTEDSNVPIKIMENVSDVSLGYCRSAAIKTDGSLWTWGTNSSGELGDGTTMDRYVPEKVMDNVAKVSLGFDHSAIIKTDGSLWIWGSNYAGQLGDGTTTDSKIPKKIMENVMDIVLGDSTSAAIKTDGSLWMWGAGSENEPAKIMDNVAKIQLGFGHCVAVKTDGSVWTWGSNYFGELGDGTLEERSEPKEIMNISSVHNIFTDVHSADWFYNSVSYVNENGLMTGLNATTFGPTQSLARAQFAVILHRMNDTPEVTYTAKFPDVPDKMWFTNAILWANSIEVVTGYSDSGLFGTADNINREQMAVMMYRYAKYMGYDISQKADFGKFADASRVNSFAEEAMQWAVGTGIITGKDNETRLDPQGNASRAECATIIMRFVEKYQK